MDGMKKWLECWTVIILGWLCFILSLLCNGTAQYIMLVGSAILFSMDSIRDAIIREIRNE